MPSTILDELKVVQAHLPDWRQLDLTSPLHIVVMSEPFLSYVFEGTKTVESRFSLHKIAPYQKVQLGDRVLMKAGLIVGCFTIDWVKEYDLTAYPIEAIRQEYGAAICGTPEFWKKKSNKRYATLMGIQNARRLTPAPITKRDRRAWIAI
jgi:hypothetical protein